MDWRDNISTAVAAVKRLKLAYGLILVILALFLVRLFYVQIIDHSYYKTAAAHDQIKKYEIPATRGLIYAQQGNGIVPIVLNTKLYTVYADPTYISNSKEVATALAKVLGGQASNYLSKLTAKNTRYSVIKQRVSASDAHKLLAYKYPGLGAIGQDYRTYPNGDMAAQLLGFVDDSGQGQYGVEQALNSDLAGKPGMVKAVTDVNGVPLAANPNNVSVQPKNGDSVVLTINTAIQKSVDQIVKQGDTIGKSDGMSAVVMNDQTGAIVAMTNYPTYDPAKYYDVTNPSVFQNGVVSHDIEPGSIMKTLTTSAALNQGVIQPNTTFDDPGHWTIDGFNITDVEHSAGTQSIATVLNLSLNTGATWMLMQMGGGQINNQARNIWHNYMVNDFMLGKPTGIDQGYESPGYVPSPNNNGSGIDLTYANTSFGQGVQVTALQMAAALSSVLNGGTYYKPRLVSQIISPSGKVQNFDPKIVKRNIVKSSVAPGLEGLMQYVMENRAVPVNFDQTKYTVGGKTGTAQIAAPGGGGYLPNKYNATFIGFVGGTSPQYVIVVFAYNPDTASYSNKAGYAGELVAQPVFASIAHMLINDGYVAPKN